MIKLHPVWLELAITGGLGLIVGLPLYWQLARMKKAFKNAAQLPAADASAWLKPRVVPYLRANLIMDCVSTPCLEEVAFRAAPLLLLLTHHNRLAIAASIGFNTVFAVTHPVSRLTLVDKSTGQPIEPASAGFGLMRFRWFHLFSFLTIGSALTL